MNLNNTKPVFARGYDLIEFYQNKVIKGSPKFTSRFEDVYFLFSNYENKKKFEADPKKFMPQYGGFCAIAMSEGKLLDPNPISFVLDNHKLYFFTRFLFGIIDAKRQWLKNPAQKKKDADSHWSQFL